MEPIVTNAADVAETVRAYLDGSWTNHLERLHGAAVVRRW